MSEFTIFSHGMCNTIKFVSMYTNLTSLMERAFHGKNVNQCNIHFQNAFFRVMHTSHVLMVTHCRYDFNITNLNKLHTSKYFLRVV